LARFLKKRFVVNTLVSPANRAVLITGCDSGFGNLVARRLDAYGFHVYAGCLYPEGEGAEKLNGETSRRLKVVKLDVTKDEDVHSVVGLIRESSLELWGIFNNAGIAASVPIEAGHGLEVFQQIFDVNVWGVIRVTKACLPLLRKSKGRVVNMASITGRFAFSSATHYGMSKTCVRAFSDGLRREMYPFGVKVVTIEPAMYSTDIMTGLLDTVDKIWGETPEEVTTAYGTDFIERYKKRIMLNLGTCRPNLDEVTEAIEEGMTSDDPEIYYRLCGPGERPSFWALEQVSDLGQDVILTGPIWAKFLKMFANKQLKPKST
jgi:NAD(P)-dependent dehydrogenase (short-subunit alcohol dehydrogenase family)